MFKKISTTGLAVFMFTTSFSKIYAADSVANGLNCTACKDGLKKPITDAV